MIIRNTRLALLLLSGASVALAETPAGLLTGYAAKAAPGFPLRPARPGLHRQAVGRIRENGQLRFLPRYQPEG
jgi:hypothetical protein